AGLDLIYGAGKLKRSAGTGLCAFPTPMGCAAGEIPQGTSLLNADATGFGVGFNVGTVFELDENNRFGLSYRYSPEIEAEGDVQYLTNSDSNGKLHMPLPDIAEFSGYHKITD
ncbi:outer membrane protein transport protein, partial [Vibrio harveyi]